MADKIVGFSIEIKGQKEILTTTKLLGLLNTQLILINNTLIEINKNSSVSLGGLTKDMKKAGDSTQQLGAVVRTSMRAFDEGNKTVQNLGNGYFEVTREIEKTAKSLKNLTKEELIQLEIDKDIARENKQIAKQQAIIQRAGKDNIASLRAQLSLATVEWKKYTVAELKSTDAGRKAAAEKLRLTTALLKEEKATGDARRQVGFYERSLGSLGKTLLKLSVGRDIIRGLFKGLSETVKNGAGSNQVFANILKSFERLKTFSTGLQTSFLNLFGGVVSKTVDNFAFVISKVFEGVQFLANGFKSLANSGGVIGTVFSVITAAIGGVINIFLEFPAVIGGVIEVFSEFKNIAVRTFSEVSLNIEKVIANIKRVGTALTGGDTSEIDKRLNEINKSLANNNIFARGIGTAFQDGFDAAKKAQEEFNKSVDDETIVLQKREAAALKQEEARKAAVENEKKRAEELKADRSEALKDLITNSQARITIISELSKDIIQAEIDAIQDQTEKAIAAEKLRFKLEKEARKKNFQDALDIAALDKAKIADLFTDSSEEYKDFVEQSGVELREIENQTNKFIEQDEKNHQDNLVKITKEGNDRQKEADKEAGKARAEIRKEYFKNFGDTIKKELAKTKELIDQSIEQAKEKAAATKDALVDLVNTAFSSISAIVDIANQAENQRFDDAINRRTESISALNEDMQQATGLQKKFLERQIKQEEAALEAETKAKEKARKEQAETQKAIAIIQAIIAAALAITNAFTLPPPASFIAAAATAIATATQIAVIASQQFAKGGVLQGKSHAEGGIPASVGGSAVELEGGEAVINKRSTAMYRPLLSQINSAGGGVKFAGGGVLNAPMAAPRLGNSQTDLNSMFSDFTNASLAMVAATNKRIDRLTVVQDLNNLQDIQKNDARLQALTTLK